MRHVAAAALAASCVVVTLCPADRGGASQSGGAPAGSIGAVDPDLHATLQRSRLFETQRSLRVAVGYDGGHDIHITTIQLSTPLFETVPAQPRDPVVRGGGGIVAMPLEFGAARCGEAADAPARLITEVDGEQLVVPLGESPSDLLVDLHAGECAAAAILAGLELRLGDRWERTGPKTIEGRFDVTQRHAGATATVDQLLGNVIFHVEAGDSGDGDAAVPLMEVGDDQPSASVPVTITASRCDPHALTEYKRTFTFIALVGLDGDEPVRVDVEAEGEAHRVLAALLPACLE